MTVSANTFRYRMWTINIYIYDEVSSSCTGWPSQAGASGTRGPSRLWCSAGWATCGPGCWWDRRTRRPPRRSPSSAWWASGGCAASPAGRTSPSSFRRGLGGRKTGHTFRFFFLSFPPLAFVMAKLPPLGAAHASETTAPCRLGHNGALCYGPRTWVRRAPSAPHLYFCFLNSVSISVHLCDLACTRLHTSSRSSKPNTICFRKFCKCWGERNNRVTKWEAGRRPAWGSSCDVLPGLD